MEGLIEEKLNPKLNKLEDMYGQCWSLYAESDALWRIYSPYKEGVQIKTKLANLLMIKGYREAYIGEVKYYDNLNSADLLELDAYKGCLIKRNAFKHEKEVRLLINYNNITDKHEKIDYIELEVDMSEFIEEVIIDPRANEWFVKMVISYCNKNGIKNVKKSKLYNILN